MYDYLRFEETRLAIKDNVKMLENVSNSTTAIDTAIDSLTATGNNTIDSASSYPYSYGKQCRSFSNNRLSAMDASSGTGTSLGLRTISSVDSGVMLTLTSSSEAGTQSRCRSFGSWTGGYGPEFLNNGAEENGPSLLTSEKTQLEESDSEGSDSTDVDSDVPNCSDSTCSEEEVFTPSPFREHSEQLEQLTNRLERSHINPENLLASINPSHRRSQQPVPLNVECRGCRHHDEERFEVQESSISFEEEEEESYEMVSLPISATYTEGIYGQTAHSRDSKCIVYSSSAHVGGPRSCIVLPAIQKEPHQRSERVNTAHELNRDDWVEKDRITAEELSRMRNSTYDLSADEHTKLLERSGSSDSRLMFSPIPEESSSDFVPNSPTRKKRSLKKLAASAAHHVTAGSQMLTLAEVHSTPNHFSADLPSPPLQTSLRITHPTIQHEEHINNKLKKYRHKRKKPPTSQPISERNIHKPLSSTTSSSSSVLDASQKSDVLSLSSYRNAIDKHAIALPQITTAKQSRVSLDSSSSSAASSCYDDVIQTCSSSSCCSDPEYDYQVSLHNLPGRHRKFVNPVSRSAGRGSDKQTNVPVLRKISKDRTSVKAKPTPAGEKGTHKHRLFKKNCSTSAMSNSKLQKTKSDEASHSLLRYFRFPSPPRTAAEDTSDSSHNKDTNVLPSQSLHVMQKTQNTSDLPGHRSTNLEGGKGTSVCSCATSSTETCSEIAYPDLCTSHVVQYMAKGHRLGVDEQRRMDSESTKPTASPPESSNANQRQGVRMNEEFRQPTDKQSQPINPEATRTGLHQARPPQLTAASSDYPIPVHQLKAQPKKSRFYLFSKIFRKQRSKKSRRLRKGQAMDPRLTLDLAGGEVRVRSQDSTEQRVGDIPYVIVPSAYYKQHLHSYRTQAQQVARPVRMDLQEPVIYEMPRQRSQYIPVVREYQQPHRYTNVYPVSPANLYPHEYTTSSGHYMGGDSLHCYNEDESMRVVRGYPVVSTGGVMRGYPGASNGGVVRGHPGAGTGGVVRGHPGAGHDELYHIDMYPRSRESFHPSQQDPSVGCYRNPTSTVRTLGRLANQSDPWREPRLPTKRWRNYQML